MFEHLASLRPQASSFPWLYHCSCLDHAPLRFPKALRRENPRKRHSNRATPKNSRGMFWFLPSHRNPVWKKFLHTREPHFCVVLLVSSSLQGTFFLSLLKESKVYPQKIHVSSFQHVHVSGNAILLSLAGVWLSNSAPENWNHTLKL